MIGPRYFTVEYPPTSQDVAELVNQSQTMDETIMVSGRPVNLAAAGKSPRGIVSLMVLEAREVPPPKKEPLMFRIRAETWNKLGQLVLVDGTRIDDVDPNVRETSDRVTLKLAEDPAQKAQITLTQPEPDQPPFAG